MKVYANTNDPFVKSYWVREEDPPADDPPADDPPADDPPADDPPKDSPKDKPSDETARLLKEVMRNKDRVKKAEADAKAAADALAGIKNIIGDLKPEELEALVSNQRETQRKQLEEQGKYEQILDQIKTQTAAEKKALEDRNAELQAELNKANGRTEELTVGRVFSDSAFIRENSVLPPSIARKEFATYFEIEDGEVVGYTKPRGVEGRAPLVDANGENKSFEVAIKELFEKHPDSKSLMKAKAKPGAGSGTETGTKPTDNKPGPSLRGIDRIAKALGSAKK